MELIIIGAVAAVVVGLAIAFAIFSRREEQLIDERLERINQANDLGFEVEEQSQQPTNVSVLEESRRLLDPFNNFITEREYGQNIKKQLARANLKLTVAEFMASHLVSAAGFFTVGYLILTSQDIVTSLIFAVIGLFAPRLYVGRKVSQRLQRFETQLPDTLGLWVNALRSGYSVLQAMEAIANDAPEPTREEFNRVVREVQIGVDMDDALNHLVTRIESEDLDLVVTAVNIQREVGGNLAEILEIISHTIRERIKLKGEIRVLTSQGRITGYLISGLPIALALFLQVASPNYMNQLFEDRFCGWPMIGAGLALIGMGTAAIQKIIDIDI